MTAAETVALVRMLLDDGVLWYLGINEINRCINQAQLFMIDKYHRMDDERALRTLYQQDFGLTNNSELSRILLYPRAARIYSLPDDDMYDSWAAEYLSYEVFINYEAPGIVYNTPMPRSAYWTYYHKMDNGTPPTMKTYVRFSKGTSDDSVCDVLYIAYPVPFEYSLDGSVDVPLSLPAEYHPEVAMLAAELANNIDVGELERGDIAIPQAGQRLTLETAGT
jgi:hypothetical protein